MRSSKKARNYKSSILFFASFCHKRKWGCGVSPPVGEVARSAGGVDRKTKAPATPHDSAALRFKGAKGGMGGKQEFSPHSLYQITAVLTFSTSRKQVKEFPLTCFFAVQSIIICKGFRKRRRLCNLRPRGQRCRMRSMHADGTAAHRTGYAAIPVFSACSRA